MAIDNYGVSTITAPTAQPITLLEVKKHLEISESIDAHDTYLNRLITVACERAEAITNRQLMTATLELRLDDFPSGEEKISLPRPPIQSVTSIKYQDTTDAQQTFSSAKYKLVSTREPGEVHLKYGQTWPETYPESDVVIVRFVAGWASAANVPQTIKQAMLVMIADWFTRRSGEEETPVAAQRLLDMHRFGDGFLSYSGACE